MSLTQPPGRWYKKGMMLRNLWQRIRYGRDKCVFCKGRKGGMPGNENLYFVKTAKEEAKPIAVCDYCTSLLMGIIEWEHDTNS